MKSTTFKAIKQIGLLLLATSMLFKAFLAPAVYIDFKLNQDYIVKVLCINREKPQLECNGQCILMQKMKKAQENEKPEQNQTGKSQLLEILSDLMAVFHPLIFPTFQKKFFEYSEHSFLRFLSQIFHPPQTA
ncbi:MAG: hypothetical protein WD426_06620 [Anditalea sp.]